MSEASIDTEHIRRQREQEVLYTDLRFLAEIAKDVSLRIRMAQKRRDARISPIDAAWLQVDDQEFRFPPEVHHALRASVVDGYHRALALRFMQERGIQRTDLLQMRRAHVACLDGGDRRYDYTVLVDNAAQWGDIRAFRPASPILRVEVHVLSVQSLYDDMIGYGGRQENARRTCQDAGNTEMNTLIWKKLAEDGRADQFADMATLAGEWAHNPELVQYGYSEELLVFMSDLILAVGPRLAGAWFLRHTGDWRNAQRDWEGEQPGALKTGSIVRLLYAYHSPEYDSARKALRDRLPEVDQIAKRLQAEHAHLGARPPRAEGPPAAAPPSDSLSPEQRTLLEEERARARERREERAQTVEPPRRKRFGTQGRNRSWQERLDRVAEHYRERYGVDAAVPILPPAS